jgi:hypothetical protein
MVFEFTGIRDPVTTTSSISSWEKALGAAVATATAIAARAKLGFLDNDLIIIASFVVRPRLLNLSFSGSFGLKAHACACVTSHRAVYSRAQM